MTQEPYKVSILVPVYGVEKYIERCARPRGFVFFLPAPSLRWHIGYRSKAEIHGCLQSCMIINL